MGIFITKNRGLYVFCFYSTQALFKNPHPHENANTHRHLVNKDNNVAQPDVTNISVFPLYTSTLKQETETNRVSENLFPFFPVLKCTGKMAF